MFLFFSSKNSNKIVFYCSEDGKPKSGKIDELMDSYKEDVPRSVLFVK